MQALIQDCGRLPLVGLLLLSRIPRILNFKQLRQNDLRLVLSLGSLLILLDLLLVLLDLSLADLLLADLLVLLDLTCWVCWACWSCWTCCCCVCYLS